MKKILLLLLVLGLAGAGWYYYAARSRAESAPEFRTTTVERGEILQVVTATGNLDSVISVDVGSQISGLIQKLYVDFNSPVKKGDKLVEIDPATYQQKLRQAEAILASAEASNQLQKVNTERVRELYARKLVTQQEYDQAMAQLQQSNAQLVTSRATVENAKVDLERCTISSPIDGIVINKQTEEGKTVAASLNAPVLFTIANDLAKMQITAAVAEADVGSVADGQQVTFTVDAFPSRSFRGQVVQVRNAPKTTNNVVTYDTIISVDNRDLKLRPGMTANVSIVVARRDNILRIANAALRLRIPDSVAVKRDEPARTPPSEPTGKADASAKKDAPAVASAPGSGSEGGQGGGRRGGGMFGNLTPEQRQKMRQISTDLGIDFRNGPPTPEQREQLRKAMAEAGLPVLESSGSGRPGESVVTTRKVYKLVGLAPEQSLEELTVKVGITDGTSSEIIDGLKEGDVIVSGISVPTTSSSSQQRSSNPFGGGPRRF